MSIDAQSAQAAAARRCRCWCSPSDSGCCEQNTLSSLRRFEDSVCSSSVSSEVERCAALLLPQEVSRRVFSQLDHLDLVNCSLVCKQWHFESGELRQGWKEEYWEVCCIRGLIEWENKTPLPRYEAYLACSPD